MATMRCALCGNEIEGTPYVGEKRETFYCEHCVKTHNMVPCGYEDCNKWGPRDSMNLTGKGYLCRDHYRELYLKCSKCSIELPRDLIIINDQRGFCQNCFDELYFKCDDCGRIHNVKNKHIIETHVNGTRTVCSKCFQNYKTCKHCGRVAHIRQMVEFTYRRKNGNEAMFTGCHECASKLFDYCSSCNTYFSKELNIQFFPLRGDDNTVCCERCYYSSRIIHDYSYKPKFKFFKKSDDASDVLFGFENEIELSREVERRDYESRDRRRTLTLSDGSKIEVDYQMYVAHEIEKILPELIYQKHDGSLSYGIELVSHPATCEFWRSQEEKIEELFGWLRSIGAEGVGAPSAGMHVHITKIGMKPSHCNSLSAFVHGNSDFISKIARRRSNHYSKIQRISSTSCSSEKEIERMLVTNHDRYQAVNWTNSKTVEIRIFQSNLFTNQFLANIEFCSALYLFSKERTAADCLSDTATEDFCSWVLDHKNYIYLPAVLEKIKD